MKIEAPFFEIIGKTQKPIPQVILDKLHESEERKGLAVEARLVDIDEWQANAEEDAQTFKQCMYCERYGTNPTNEPYGDVIWKNIDEFDAEEKAEFAKALEKNPLLRQPGKLTGKEPVGVSTGICPSCFNDTYGERARFKGAY